MLEKSAFETGTFAVRILETLPSELPHLKLGDSAKTHVLHAGPPLHARGFPPRAPPPAWAPRHPAPDARSSCAPTPARSTLPAPRTHTRRGGGGRRGRGRGGARAGRGVYVIGAGSLRPPPSAP
ncbi:translation initiation factor IF-2-like [Peromyscus leucopus]|uniref:translation initiation factor IF-2-like n=1 Tax=Peromyscus leucopus TaxID=10041 RepID=UPI0018854BDD|nr:translation initiation factor IF-2-like [Peromyscus leucopus]